MNKQKKTFLTILLVFTLILMVLPFLVSFNEGLTKILEKNFLYEGIQRVIVPVEAKILGVILMFFGYQFSFSPTNSLIITNGVTMGLTWNCLGWQSFIFLVITFLVGFRAKYTQRSIGEGLLLGVLGTFWVNILRMLFTILLAVHFPPIFRVVFHDYLAAVVSVGWLFLFWWFAYSYVLEEKKT